LFLVKLTKEGFMNFIIIWLCLFISVPSKAKEFSSLLKKVEGHPNIEAIRQKFLKQSFAAEAQSSLKDPSLKFSAFNLPTPSLSFDKTPMSSKQVTLAQQIPMTSRFSHLNDQAGLLDEAGKSQVKFQVSTAKANLWIVSANIESLKKQLAIVKDSLSWMRQVDKSTQRLYSTGKTNQINLLEIKVRKTELEAQIQELAYKIEAAKSQVGYLVGEGKPTTVHSVPWHILDKKSTDNQTNDLESSLKKQSMAASSKLKATQLTYVPDLTVGATYSFRENIDNQGDFVTGFVQFSIPLWGQIGDKVSLARSEANEQNVKFENYKLQKSKMRHSLKQKISSLLKELDLISKSIKFSETEIKLAIKSYSLGKMGVFELLEVELRLRKKKSKKELLKENLRKSQVELLLLQGDSLDV